MKKFKLLYVVFFILWVVYGLYLVLKLDWTFFDVKMLTIVAAILFTLTALLYSILLYKRHYRKSVYISCAVEDKEKLDYIINIMPKSVKVEDTLTLDSGEHLMSSLKDKIGKSTFCFMIIGQKMTKLQRLEHRTMKNLGKECVPIVVAKEYELKTFKNIVPVFLKDKKMKDKLIDILLKKSIFI